MSQLLINPERLWAAISQLGRIGAYFCDDTQQFGVNRLALTQADGQGRCHVLEKMRSLGLTVSIDRIGNVYGRRAGQRNDLSPVILGSHIDSVPTAGRFDGCLGVLGALEIVETLNEAQSPTYRPLVVAFFTDEEGARFGTDMLGSAVATGRIGLEQAYALTDRDGLCVKDELRRLGFLGEVHEKLTPPHAYLECHIEQGPVLRKRHVDLGIVQGVQAISWHKVTIVGKSAHAGTTPMELRADASCAASRINLQLREMTRSGHYGTSLRATMGAMFPTPGMVNIVPGKMLVTVDLRNPDDTLLSKAEADLLDFCHQMSQQEGVTLTWQQTARTQAVAFDAGLQRRIAHSAAHLGLSTAPIVSGAGHDAQEFARLCPTAMVFVPGELDGISHNPREFSTQEQCANGVNVLLHTALSVANEFEAGPTGNVDPAKP